MPTKKDLEQKIAQLERQLAEAVPVCIVTQAVFDELAEPTNLAEFLDRADDPNPERINNGCMVNRRNA